MFQFRKVKIEKLKIKSFEVNIKNTETMHDSFDMPICLIYSGFTRLKKVTGLYTRHNYFYIGMLRKYGTKLRLPR